MYTSDHPILSITHGRRVTFLFEGESLEGFEGEPISAALHAAGIRVLSHSPVLHRPRGFFCSIGNCSSCLMTVDGIPNVRVCNEGLREGMVVARQVGKGRLPVVAMPAQNLVSKAPDREMPEYEVAIVGAGPAGLSAALTATGHGARVALVDRQDRLGGQPVKQTHKFFGSRKERAGTRGFEIARQLEAEVEALHNIHVMRNATALGYYPDSVLTYEQDGAYRKLRVASLVVCTGASKRMLAFGNNDMPGVYGAGAVQTSMNVNGVFPARRVVLVGAGNIGLIVSYQLRQAGVQVAAVVEAAPRINGYDVHAAKIGRLGIPILTSHTVVSAHDGDLLEGVTICRVDESWQNIRGTPGDLKLSTIRPPAQPVSLGASAGGDKHEK